MTSIAETLQTGLDHHRAGRFLEAEHFYRRVLEAHPRHAGAYHLLGLLAFQVGKHELAAQLVGDAARFDAFHPPYRVDLGEIYQAMGNTPEAIKCYEHALKLDSELAPTQNSLGVLYKSQGELSAAMTCFRTALEIDPQNAAAYRNVGTLLQAEGNVIAAQEAYEQSARLAPDDASTYFCLGSAMQEQGQLLEAIACYQKAVRLRPDLEEGSFQLATARLALGDFANGWPGFESFYRQHYSPTSPLPLWNGGDLEGRSIWVHAHYSLADVLQFIRYVPLIRQRGGKVFLDADPKLAPLLKQSGFENLISADDPPPKCDGQIHLMSLPRIFRTTVESIPAATAYLTAYPQLVQNWREKLKAIPGLKVGICWQGNPAHPLDLRRSVPLREFGPLARVANVSLISLQRQYGLDQLPTIDGQFQVSILDEPWDEANGLFMDTAAIMANLDLVITADTATAHLAGALGVNTWAALSVASDWCWLRDRDDCPWYSSIRLFRQSKLGKWSDVFQRMATELSVKVTQKP